MKLKRGGNTNDSSAPVSLGMVIPSLKLPMVQLGCFVWNSQVEKKKEKGGKTPQYVLYFSSLKDMGERGDLLKKKTQKKFRKMDLC